MIVPGQSSHHASWHVHKDVDAYKVQQGCTNAYAQVNTQAALQIKHNHTHSFVHIVSNTSGFKEFAHAGSGNNEADVLTFLSIAQIPIVKILERPSADLPSDSLLVAPGLGWA